VFVFGRINNPSLKRLMFWAGHGLGLKSKRQKSLRQQPMRILGWLVGSVFIKTGIGADFFRRLFLV